MLALLLLFLYAVAPQVAGFGKTFGVIARAELGYVLLAFMCWIAIYLLAVAMYMVLALHPIYFKRTFEAQLASGFTGKLLPSGLGVLGLFVQYLRRRGHTTTEAVAVASLNNLTAVVGHVGLLVLLFVLGTPLPDIDTERFLPSGSSMVIVGIIAMLTVAAALVWHNRVVQAWRSIKKTLSIYRTHPRKVILAVLISVPQTFAYMGVLYMSMLALGMQLDFNVVFMVATFSMLVGTIIPVPGGIVGAEAGLTAGFVAYGLTVQEGLAIALLYRAFIYWLPIIPGLIVFAYRRRDYV